MHRRTLPIVRPLILAVALPLTVLACVSALAPSRTSRPRHALAWVTNEGSGDVTVIDTATDELVATVEIGKRPRGVRVDHATGRVFAAVSGTPRTPPSRRDAEEPSAVAVAAHEPADRAADGIAVVDPATLRLVSVLPSGQDPEAFDLLPGGRSLVVSNEETSSASVVDVVAGRLLSTIAVGEEPAGVTVAPDGALVAVASERSHRVDFVDPAAARVVARVPTCLRPRSVAFTPDGALAFAACEEAAAVAVIDVRALRPLGEIPLPPGSRPMGTAIAKGGARLFVSNGRAGTVSVVDVASRAVVATIPDVGERPWGLALTPDGKKLYVANGPSNDVAVVDTASLRVVNRIRAGDSPWGIAIAE